MVEALDPAAYIYEGIWTDWSKGSVRGLTWTLCPTQATLLTNSLAVFVTVAGGQLWTIIRFALHQTRTARGRASRGGVDLDQLHLKFQQQVILRNAATDLHTMRLMVQLAWESRGRPGRVLRYTLTIAALAVVHYTLFLAAGTLSNNLVNAGSGQSFSKLANGSSAVLSRSPHCGFWTPNYKDNIVDAQGINPTSLETVNSSIQYNAKIDQSVQLSLQYVEDCYGDDPNYYMSSKCESMPKPRLDFNQTDGICPFDSTLCHDHSTTIVFDTGYLDSHSDLGINSRSTDRLIYRRRTACSVLNDTRRVFEFDQGTSQASAYAYYGASLFLEGTNYTYSYNNFSSLYTTFTASITNPYQVNTQGAYGASPVADPFSSFEPIDELKQDSADVMLFFLSFSGKYFEPVTDPWFSASQLHLVDTHNPVASHQYSRDSLISTLGCSEQHQFCKPNGGCTDLLGWGQVQSVDVFNAALTPYQAVILDRMQRAIFSSSMSQVVQSLATSKTPLLATDMAASQNTVLSLKLPENQWKLEAKNWHSIAMAQLQRTMVQWSTGQIAPDPSTQLSRPKKDSSESWFCSNLLIPSTVYQSFSVLWLALILSIGTFVIIISWTVEDVSGWMHMRSNRGATLRKVWDEHQMLRLKELDSRNSWRPQPPPKGVGYEGQSFRYANYMELSPPVPAYNIHRTSEKPAQTSDFSWFQAPQIGKEAAIQHTVSTTPEVQVSPARLWSQLPREPSRDSWVEAGLKQAPSLGDRATPKRSSRHDTWTKYNEVPSLRTGPSTRVLGLSDLRAHALARSRDAWV